MKLTSTLNPNSVAGCCSGGLSLTFTLADWSATSQNWNFAGGGTPQTYSLTPDVQVFVSLAPGFNGAAKGFIGVIGQMKVTVNNNVLADTGGPWGSGATKLVPNATPANANVNFFGALPGGASPSNSQLGFCLPLAWDGTGGGTGQGFWWAFWTNAAPAQPLQAPSNAKVSIQP